MAAEGKGAKRMADDDDDDNDVGGKRRKLNIEVRNGREYIKGTKQPARSVYDEQPDTDDFDTPGASEDYEMGDGDDEE